MNLEPNVARGSETKIADAIRDDRELLNVLGMSDPEAASFLGRSRQALHAQLGSRKEPGQGPTNYFKLSDILMLVTAARRRGRRFDAPAVKNYVERTRRPKQKSDQTPYDMVIEMLVGEAEPLQLDTADIIVFVLPAFVDFCGHRPAIAKKLKQRVAELSARETPPAMFVLSSTSVQAKAAGQWLRLPADRAFAAEVVEHYLPMVLVYDSDRPAPRPYTLTENDTFEAAPEFRAHVIAACVLSLLPEEVSQFIRNSRPPDDD